jgi:Protein of unknown function (DUF1552)
MCSFLAAVVRSRSKVCKIDGWQVERSKFAGLMAMSAKLTRRSVLRAGAVCIGLPLLDAMLPIGLGAEKNAAHLGAKRMLLIGRPLGLHTPYLFPTKAGKDYEPTRYLKLLADYRQEFTVFSGMSHLGYPGGHHTDVALLTGVAPERMRAGDVRNTISLDQEAAERIGNDTRFASLVLGGGNQSWNRRGLQVPSEASAKQVFKKLFIEGTAAEVAHEIQKIESGRSILDGVRAQTRSLSKSLGPSDRGRLDLMLASIREAEQQLRRDQAWIRTPKPKVSEADARLFEQDPKRMLDRERQLFDLVHLALQMDSTRAISLLLWSHNENLEMPGVSLTHHDASHHGQDEGKLKQLAMVEEAELKIFADFLGKMKASNDGGPTLLDQTIVFHCSNLGNASSHDVSNLPVILAGGGFKHAGHVAYDRRRNTPLSNLFVRMLQQLGLDMDRFGSSTSVVGEV